MSELAIIIISNLVVAAVAFTIYKVVYAPAKFVVNFYTKEIHSKYTKDVRCQIKNMTNCKEINGFEKWRLLKKGYNGCRHCLPEHDTDLVNYKKGIGEQTQNSGFKIFDNLKEGLKK